MARPISRYWHRVCRNSAGPWVAPVICEICKQGRVTKRMEEMEFRQWSDKGYIHCRATILIGTCNNCHVKHLDPGSDKILDEAFQREYDKFRLTRPPHRRGST